MKNESSYRVKKKSMLSRIVTSVLSTVMLLSTASVLPDSITDKIISNDIIASANGDGSSAAGYTSNNPTGSGRPGFQAGWKYGYKFYLIGGDGEIVKKYGVTFTGYGINESYYFYSTDAQVNDYIKDWATFLVMQKDKAAATDLYNSIKTIHKLSGDDALEVVATNVTSEEVASTYNDSSKYETVPNGSNFDVYERAELYSKAEIIDAINNHYNAYKSIYEYNKDGIIAKINAISTVKNKSNVDCIKASDAKWIDNQNQFARFNANDKKYSNTSASVSDQSDKPIKNLNLASGLFVKNNYNSGITGILYKDSSGNVVSQSMIIDVTAGGDPCTQNDLRFPLYDNNSSILPLDTISVDEMKSKVGGCPPLPSASGGKGMQVREFMYQENTTLKGELESKLGAGRAYNKYAIYGNLFFDYNAPGGGELLLKQSYSLFNDMTKSGFSDTNTEGFSDIQKKYAAFQLVVEPIVDLPLNDNESNIFTRQINGTWTAYMRGLNQDFGMDGYGGRYTMQRIKQDIGSGYYCSADDAGGNALVYGDYYIRTIPEAKVGTGTVLETAFSKKKGYEYFFRSTDPEDDWSTTWEATPFGIQIYWMGGSPGTIVTEDPEGINTYAVDITDLPDSPARPEYSHDKSDNPTGSTPSGEKGYTPPSDGTGTYTNSNDNEPFQIVKVYADLYRDDNSVAYRSSPSDIEAVKKGNELQFYYDPRTSSSTYNSFVVVDRSGNMYSSVTKYDSYGYVESGTKVTGNEPAVLAKDGLTGQPLAVIGSDSDMFGSAYYTGIAQTHYTYMTDANRNVFITEEMGRTRYEDPVNPENNLNGYKLVSWQATGNYETDRGEAFSVNDWLTLDTAGEGNNHGGYKLKLNFDSRSKNNFGTVDDEYRYDPTSASNIYSRLYEMQSPENHKPEFNYEVDGGSAATVGSGANEDGSLCIDDTNLHTLYLLYVRELPYIDTDGAGSGTGSGTGSGERTTDTNPGGKGTGKGTGPDEKLPQHKFNIVKVYGVINPYTYKVTPTAVYAQSKNTYNVRIRDEYNTSYELGGGLVDTSNYHLRAYTVVDSTPSQVYGKTFPDGSIANGSMIILSDSITIGSPVEGARTINNTNCKSITPSASMFDADHWADGWTNFKSEDYADNTKIVEYDNRGFIDGYDGVAWTDKGLAKANKSLTPVMSSAMKTDEVVFLDSSSHLPGATGSSEPLYVYTPDGYDRTIYFGDKSDGGYKNEGTLYLLYLQGDILDYSGAVVIPESYITRRFDLGEVDVKISGAIQGTDTTSEGSHSIASHRFRISTPNIQSAIAAGGFHFLAPNDWSFTSPDYYPSANGWTRSSSMPSGWGTANPPNNIGAMDVRYNYIDRKNIVIDFIGINDVAMNIGLDFKDSAKYSKNMLDRGLGAVEGSLVDASGLFNSMTVMHRIVPADFDPLKDCGTLDFSDKKHSDGKKYQTKNAYVVNTQFINKEFLLTGDDYVSGQDAHGAAKNGRNWAQAHTYQFNGLLCEIVLGRVDDPVTVAGWKYGLASEVKRTAVIKWSPGTGSERIGRGYSMVKDLSTSSRRDINKIINLEDTGFISTYFTDTNAMYYVTDITYIRNTSNSHLLTALVEYREISAHRDGTWEVYTTHSKQITSDNFNSADTSLTELESNLLTTTLGSSVVFDSVDNNKTSIANLSNLWSSSDYVALLNTNKNYVSALGVMRFRQLNRLSDLSLLNITNGLSEQSTKPVIVDNVARVTRSSYGVQRSEAIDAFDLKPFSSGSDFGLAKANIPDGVSYNGHPVKSANKKDFNFFIGPIGYLSSDAAAAYGSTMGNSHQFLDREIAYYSVKTKSVEDTVTRTNEDGTTDTYTTYHTEYQYTRYRRNEPLVFEDATKLDLTLSSYAYSYSGIAGTPYYIQHSGVYVQDGITTARISANIDYDFTNPELKNEAGSQYTGRWLPVVNFSELFESTGEKVSVGNLKYFASITNEPVKSIILNNDNAYEMGIRKSALAENHAVVFYPYYLMQYETNDSYNKGADGEFKANPLLIAGSYSRMFVPDEYQGVKLHDGNGTINFNVHVYVVNNGTTDAAGKINITSEQWSTHATANATIGKQNCVLPGGAMFGVMIKNENRRYVDVETYAPILPDGDGRKHIEATAGGSTSYRSGGSTIAISGINDILAANSAGDATGGLPKAYEGSEFEQRHAELQKSVETYMGSLNIDTYVDKQSNGSVDVSGKYNSAGEDNAEHYLSGHKDLSENPDNLVSQEDIKKIQKNDGKYYLREENNTTSDANAADLDVGVVDETKMFYTFFTTVDGRVLCHVSTTAEDSAKTTSDDYNNFYGHMASTTNTVPATNSLGDPGQVYVVLDRGQQVDTLTGLWKDFNDKTNVVTKLCEALERNHGYDPQSYYKRNGVLSDADISYSGWYNEAFDGITYVKHVTKLAVGFVDPFERSAVLDPTLTPTQSGKEDMFSKYNAAQFMTADHCLQAIEDGYTDGMGTTTDGETISVIGKLDINGKAYEVGIDPEKLKKLFISDIFFVPNATVQDLK